MTMSSAVSKVTLNGDGVQTEFPFAFKVWKAGDLEVSITSPAGANTVVTDWTVVLGASGGTVTYPLAGAPLPLGWKITLRRSMDFLQDVDLVSGTRFDPEVIETALDIATAERQQLLEEISRAVRVGVASEEDPANVVNQVFGARDAAQDYVVDAQTAKAGAEIAEDGARAAQLAAEAISTEAAARAYNYITNGNFDIWQRGTSQTTSGYGSADRWACGNVGSTKTASQQIFTLGQTDVPDNPKYYMRHVVTSVAGAGNYSLLAQKIEYVKTLAGKTAALSFWAKADSSKNIALEFYQNFGTGGTPSSTVYGIGSQLVALTTSWKKYTITVDIPSIAGKTLGTNGNDFLVIHFWFDAGSTYATRAANLGQQSGTFDIANISLVEGDVDVKPIPRSYGEELVLCQRYYQRIYVSARSYLLANHYFSNGYLFPVQLRSTPIMQIITAGSQSNVSSKSISVTSPLSFRFEIVSAGVSGDTYILSELYGVDAEL